MVHTQRRASVVAAAAVLAACVGCTADPAAPPTTPESIEQRLWQVAEQAAEDMNGRIATAQAVKSHHAVAVRLTSGAEVPGDEDVWAIQIEGSEDFVCRPCTGPPGSRPSRGRFITLVIDAETLDTTDWGLARHSVDLSELGTVIELHD